MDPLGDSGQYITDIPAELERQVARAGRAMARLRVAQQRLGEQPEPPESWKKVVDAGINGATAGDSTVERLARVVASLPEHTGATELLLAAMRAVDGIESCAEIVERAADANAAASPRRPGGKGKRASVGA